MDEKLLRLLGLARRAVRLSLGSEAARDALKKRKPALLLLASDLSARAAGEFSALAERAAVPSRSIRATMSEVEAALGKRSGVIAVNDMGFAKALRAMIAENEEEIQL